MSKPARILELTRDRGRDGLYRGELWINGEPVADLKPAATLGVIAEHADQLQQAIPGLVIEDLTKG